MAARTYTSRQIATALGHKVRRVQRTAINDGWPYQDQILGGRRTRVYAFDDLPLDVQEAISKTSDPQPQSSSGEDGVAPLPSSHPSTLSYDPEELWSWAESRSRKQRERGAFRAGVIERVEQLVAGGSGFRPAAQTVAGREGLKAATIENWYYGRSGRPGARKFRPEDRAAALIPGWVGRSPRREIPQEAWDWFLGYYLTRRQPTLAESWRRTREVARDRGWGRLPSVSTFSRRLQAEVSPTTRVYRREGREAVAKLHPTQRRDKRALAAGRAATGDGLKFDRLWVLWPDGEVLNTTTGWFWADVRTGYLAAWRVAKTENTDLFRLATYDLTKLFKPDVVWVDNTMVAASKAMTGGARHRNRGKDKAGDPLGLLIQLGIDVRFTNPSKITGNPGAKPIERSFGIGGIHEKVATHPKFLNRGYSKKTAIPYDDFVAVVAEEVARHNAQPKRRTAVCRGVLSFEQAFEESYRDSVVKKLTESQRALLLLMQEVCRADRRRGEIRLKAGRGPMGRHRYWSEDLLDHRGRQVVVYYDPEDLSSPVTVTTLDGRKICQAQHLEDVGFADTAAGREWAKNKSRFVKASRKAAEAQVRMSELEVAALYPEAEAAEIPEPGVVGGQFGQRRKVVNGEVVEVGRSIRELPSPLRTEKERAEHEELVRRGDDRILEMGRKLLRPREEDW